MNLPAQLIGQYQWLTRTKRAIATVVWTEGVVAGPVAAPEETVSTMIENSSGPQWVGPPEDAPTSIPGTQQPE
jgi:hypothetical protein